MISPRTARHRIFITAVWLLCFTATYSSELQELHLDSAIEAGVAESITEDGQEYLSSTESTIDSYEDLDSQESQEFIEEADALDQERSLQAAAPHLEGRMINEVIVQGNKHIPVAAITNRLPYQKGDHFNAEKSRGLIKRLYEDLKRLRYIALEAELVGDDAMILYVIVEEKKILKDYQFIGNTKISAKDILEKIPFGQIPAIDPEELPAMVAKMKRLYRDKGYNHVDIEANIVFDADDKARITFTFHEYPQSLVKKIRFTGNECITDKELRSVIYSKEDWLLGFMDQSGIYQVERTEADRYQIEQHYQNKGYIAAKVIDVRVEYDECNNITLYYDIAEGAKYTIASVSVDAAEDVDPQKLLSVLPLVAGDIYSRENVMESIKLLEHIWGDRGYIFANVEPSIVPHDDTQTVDIAFHYDLGDKVFLNRITIMGHKKTRDKVIRRNISLIEGELITNSGMESSKNRIEGLGYFDVKDGVTWKINRLDQNLADLDLVVKEGKTGHMSFQFGFGGTANMNSPADGLSTELNVNDSNLFGFGVSVNASGRFSKNEQTFMFNIAQPWLFDKPIMVAMDAYHKRIGYSDFQIINAITEQRTGGGLMAGRVFLFNNGVFTDLFTRFNLGIDGLSYGGLPAPTAHPNLMIARAGYDPIINNLFSPGAFGWAAFTIGQEKKNHPTHASRGYAWVARGNVGFPISSCNGFGKFDLDFHWYTPLIGHYDLIFHWHSYLGFAKPLKNHGIPYGELFHIGGPASVRGYVFGQISPQYVVDNRIDSIGASKTLFVNAELVVPIKDDMTMKAVVFYDGGAGWDSPFITPANQAFVRNNSFDYRHSIGAGIRLLQPMPIKIDVGFKLDPRGNESPYEVHFGMTSDF